MMASAKDEIRNILNEQPDDSSTEELVRKLAFHVMVQRGLADADAGRIITNEKMKHRIQSWAQ